MSDRETQYTLPFEWYRLAVDFLSETGHEDENFRNKKAKDRILDAIAYAFWESFTEYSQSIGVTIHDIGEALGYHGSNVNRWIKGGSWPHPKTLFGALVLVLKIDIGDVKFASNRIIVPRAVKLAIGSIREKECIAYSIDPEALQLSHDATGRGDDVESGGRCEPTDEELVCMHKLVSHREASKFLYGDYAQDQLELVYSSVQIEIQRLFPSGCVTNDKAFCAVIRRWGLPYLLFRLGLVRGWEVLNEDAI